MVIGGGRERDELVWGSALLPPYTGAGVFQRQVYGRLSGRGLHVVAPEEPPNRALRAVQSFGRMVRAPYAAALVCATPSPLVLSVPVVLVVYDLRWRRTRGLGPRLYHYADLRRMVAKADHIFVISERTRKEMLEVHPGAERRCTVLHLGPGIVRQDDFSEGEAGTVLLAGGRRYKRNELVAEALALARPDWAQRFLCVGVRDQVFQTLVGAFGGGSCERFDQVNDELMRTVFRRAQVYITASMEEGFGLPMAEALSAGCQVVAIRQPVTVEIMGDAAVLIDDGDAVDIAHQLKNPVWVPDEARLAHSATFSWDRTAEEVANVLERVSHPPYQ